LTNPIGVSSSVASSTQAFTTSTVYTTNIYTITKCPATVTNCPVGKVTTDVVTLYTTVCPVKSTPTPQLAQQFTTSTVYTTTIYTITKCPATVVNCPVGSVTTDIISLYTTVCPVTQSATNTVVAPQTNGSPARPASTPPYAAILPSQGASASGKASVSTASPGVVSISLLVGPTAIAEENAASSSTSVAVKGAANASGTAKPSAAYTGPTANGGARNLGVGTSLVLVIAAIFLVL
jgi:chitinase